MTGDIFSVFGIIDENAEVKKQKEAAEKEKAAAERAQKLAEIKQKSSEALAKPAEPKAAAAKKSEGDKFVPTEDTVIRYYGESYEITSYFSPEEIAEGLLINKKDEATERKPLDLEMLRKKMERDFPELVKEYTDMVFVKSKNIVIPMPKAKKKGNCREASSIDDASSPAYPFPKIPFSILRDFISIARLYGEEFLEIHADIYFNKEKETYFLDWPSQLVHKYWVEVTEDSASIVERVETAIKVLEIHSHHIMPAKPSHLDNESECMPGMYYAIVGKTHKLFPDIFVRTFVSGDVGHHRVKADEIFESPFFEIPGSFDTDVVEVEKR